MKLDPNPHKTSAESASLLSYRGGGGTRTHHILRCRLVLAVLKETALADRFSVLSTSSSSFSPRSTRLSTRKPTLI